MPRENGGGGFGPRATLVRMRAATYHAGMNAVRRPLALLLLPVLACRAAGPPWIPPSQEPSSARLWEDVAWLADDARAGRRAGTPGERAAAEFIARRFQTLALEPAGEDGWFQEFEVALPVRDGGKSAVVVLGRGTVRHLYDGAERVAPLFCSAGTTVQGDLVFAGYGIERPERDWNDYAELDVDGKVVLILRGTPRTIEAATSATAELVTGSESHGAAADASVNAHVADWGSTAGIFHKVMEAKRRGAVAVLVANHPLREDQGLLAFDAGQTAQAGIPALMIASSLAEVLAGDFAAAVRAIDAKPPGRPGLAVERVEVVADVERERGLARNVLARLQGEDSSRVIVLGAHFDHLGRGDVGSLERTNAGAIHNGADDNASGTAVVLELARILVSEPTPPCDVVFALWSGEELGLIGSKQWIARPTFPRESVLANLNFDMVGRAGAGRISVLGAGSSAVFEGQLAEAGSLARLELDVSLSGQGMGGSDHQSFLGASIPALHFFSGVHTDYHRASDDIERFEPDGAARVARLAHELVLRIGSARELDFVAYEAPEGEAGASRAGGGFNVWFGSVPEYTFEGPGVLLSGTSEGSPAERAGLLAGDIVIGIGDIELESIYDLVYALNHYKPGDVVLTRYLRDGREEAVRMTLLARRVAVE